MLKFIVNCPCHEFNCLNKGYERAWEKTSEVITEFGGYLLNEVNRRCALEARIKQLEAENKTLRNSQDIDL